NIRQHRGDVHCAGDLKRAIIEVALDIGHQAGGVKTVAVDFLPRPRASPVGNVDGISRSRRNALRFMDVWIGNVYVFCYLRYFFFLARPTFLALRSIKRPRAFMSALFFGLA